jgi:hypothetical protein
LGICNLRTINDANIPVNIFLNKEDDGTFSLVADNFMPRKNYATDGAYHFQADTKEELVEIVKTKILPLYQNAINLLSKIIDGSGDQCYYWSKKD